MLTSSMDCLYTPLIETHRSLGAQLAPFNGWLMPIQYSSILNEHEWTRTRASLFDICHMAEFFFSGDPLVTGLERLLTVGLTAMDVGMCKYGFMLNERGGIRDDLVVYRLRRNVWMLVVNAGPAADDEAYLKSHMTPDASLKNGRESIGKLDLQGPVSGRVLEQLAGPALRALSYYRAAYFDVMGKRMLISRTGYTGELGFELYVPLEIITRVWDTLCASPDVKPAGLGCRDTLRLEMGYPLYGQDIGADTTPLEAGLGQFIDFSKDFVGKKALEAVRSQEAVVSKRLVMFGAASRKSPRHGHKILSSGRDEIGVVTSGSFAPSLGRGIGMGYVRTPCMPGERLILSDGVKELEVTVEEKPLYKKGTAKEKLV